MWLPRRRSPRLGPAVALLLTAALWGATLAPAYSVVVGIGDSVTAATHCACPGFVQPYAAHLPTSAGGAAGRSRQMCGIGLHESGACAVCRRSHRVADAHDHAVRGGQGGPPEGGSKKEGNRRAKSGAPAPWQPHRNHSGDSAWRKRPAPTGATHHGG